MSHAPVLLVDPNADGLELYSTALALEGIDSRTARSVDEALRRMESGLPRALVTGLRLPGVGGADLIRRVRRTAPDANIFIVALASNGDLDTPVAHEAGCDVVLPLPCLPETLLSTLRDVLM